MSFIGTKRMRFASMVLPGNFMATRASARVKELRGSISEHGLINLPVIQASTKKPLAGHDRIAALLERGDDACEVRLWEGTATDFRRTQIAENLHRRNDDRGALLAEYSRLAAAEIEAAQPGTAVHLTPSVKPTVSNTSKAEARKKTGAAAGVKPASVKKAEQRARAKAAEPEDRGGAEAGEAPSAAPVAALPPGFESFGIEMVPGHVANVVAITEALNKADQLLRQAQAAITSIAGKAYPTAMYQRLREHVHTAAAQVRYGKPIAVCPWCKSFGPAGSCNGCQGFGFIVEDQRGGVPKDLWAPGVVAVNGQIVPKVAAPLQRFADKHRMAVKLVGDDGSETDFEPLEDAEVSA